MKTWIKRTLQAAAVVALLGAGAVATALAMGEWRRGRTVDVKAVPVAIPGDAAALARGDYLYRSRGCGDCHGARGEGRRFVDEGGLVAQGPKIAPGAGSAVAGYRPEDWVRTIRHGVKPDGRPAMFMPSEDFNRLTDADLGAIVAHVRALPDVPGGPAVLQMPLPVRVLYGLGAIPDAAAKIDHRLPPQTPVPEDVTPEHGRYVAASCTGCHGLGFSGGAIPGAPPAWPAAANLTPGEGSVLPRYADADAFVKMMRGGKRPDGSAIAIMPFEALSQMSEVDLRAVHAYLRTLPPRPKGGR